jgi:hypothetical protein
MLRSRREGFQACQALAGDMELILNISQRSTYHSQRSTYAPHSLSTLADSIAPSCTPRAPCKQDTCSHSHSAIHNEQQYTQPITPALQPHLSSRTSRSPPALHRQIPAVNFR